MNTGWQENELYLEFPGTKPKKRYDFYLVYVGEDNDLQVKYDEDDDILKDVMQSSLADSLNAFSTSKFRVEAYISQFRLLYNKLDYQIYEFHNLTYEEFEFACKKELGYVVSANYWIDSDTVRFNQKPIYYISRMEEDMYDDYEGFSEVEVCFRYAYYETREFVNTQYVHGEDIEIIRKLLEVLTDKYFFMVTLVENLMYDSEPPMKRFLSLPDDIKIALTKLCDFPKPLEEYDYYDIVDYYYLIWYYMYWQVTITTGHEIDDFWAD